MTFAFVIVGLLLSAPMGFAQKKRYTRSQVDAMVQAKSVYLIDALTGKVIYERNKTKPYPPASTVKLMTALLAYELKGGIEGKLLIESSDTRVEPSHVPLIPGETVAIRDLFRALLVGSDNDTALAIARFAGGSYQRFVFLMNDRAERLGCQRTRFVNPNGLPASGQFTTAVDLMKIFEAAMKVSDLRRICQLPSFVLETKAGRQTVKNHNKLLGTYPGMGPAKTGWTYASRHTYAAAATREGRELHLILLNSPNKWIDARVLFDYGFANLPEKDPERMTQIPVQTITGQM